MKVIYIQTKSLSAAAIFRMLRVCDENCALDLVFLISAGSLLKSSAASFLKIFEVLVDVAISGAEFDLKFLVCSVKEMSIYSGLCRSLRYLKESFMRCQSLRSFIGSQPSVITSFSLAYRPNTKLAAAF